MNGWIKLHRQLLEWEWYKDQNTKALFLHLLLIANFKEGTKVLGFVLHKGQVITKLSKLSEETGLSVQQVRTALKHLLSSGEITQKVTNKFRIITVVNWAFYQSGMDIVTINQQANNKQSTSVDKEVKEVKEEKKYNISVPKTKKANRFINYPQSYTTKDIERIEELERAERLQDSRF